MNLEELFEKYKEISLNIMKTLDNDLVEQLDSKFEERKGILKQIILRNENKEVLKELYEKYGLFKVDEEMNEKFKYAMDNVKSEMAKVQKRKEANRLYNNVNARAVYFSKKI
ncbi:hypothetical protein OD350_18635 [Clostridium beijerinckii]|uniref:hypothetical protein n=1 Tax=Clostridium beijerinckii TaxID=1520 RepID=UPI0022264619|nr:hypothetical protein [Clostridium beijerinckii]UYZ34264.1 hypothetical protein OD350_18635 [Clostridium beijerinckii]